MKPCCAAVSPHSLPNRFVTAGSAGSYAGVETEFAGSLYPRNDVVTKTVAIVA